MTGIRVWLKCSFNEILVHPVLKWIKNLWIQKLFFFLFHFYGSSQLHTHKETHTHTRYLGQVFLAANQLKVCGKPHGLGFLISAWGVTVIHTETQPALSSGSFSLPSHMIRATGSCKVPLYPPKPTSLCWERVPLVCISDHLERFYLLWNVSLQY